MIPLQGIIHRLRLFPLLEAKWLQNLYPFKGDKYPFEVGLLCHKERKG